MRWILFVLLAATAASSNALAAENWVLLHQIEGETTWVDLNSIVSEKSVRTFDEKIATPNRSIRARLQIDCDANTEANVSTQMYDLKGKLLMNLGPGEFEAFDNPVQVKLRNLVCGQN